MTVTRIIAVLLWAASAGRAGAAEADSVDAVLKQMQEKTAKIQSYQGQIEYWYKQPLLESQSRRKGVLYYEKAGTRSKLRVNFETLKQDEEKEQKYAEHFIFDGVWLTHINYQVESWKKHQVAEANNPTDAFELASKNLPILGFSRIDELKRDFEIRLVEEKSDSQGKYARLHLTTKPDSKYINDYKSIDFWVDRKLGLPARVVALTPDEGDVYEIKFLKPQANKKLSEKVFEIKVPKEFGPPEVIPLKKGEKARIFTD